MSLDTKMILVGIFSYNEGENLRNMYNEIKKQRKGLECKIVLVDESDDPESVAILKEILLEDNVEILTHSRRGKFHGYNVLYDHFLSNDYDILLHFDTNHLLSDKAVFYLANSIESGYDISTCFNKPMRPLNFFQRVLYIMHMPPSVLCEKGDFDFPLVGHDGAYNRKAVESIGKIPIGGINEEIYVLSKVLTRILSHTIVKNTISYFALPSTLFDYIRGTRRICGRLKAYEERYYNTGATKGIKRNSDPIVKSIYSRPPLKLILKSLFSDPVAAVFVPFVFIVRYIIMNSSKVYDSDTWEMVETTKTLKQGPV